LKGSRFAVYRHLSPQANGFDGKSDGKNILGVLFRNFTVKPIRGTRETRASHYALVSPIGRIVDVFDEWRVWSEQSGRSRPTPAELASAKLTPVPRRAAGR
jgi:hypothetical protein